MFKPLHVPPHYHLSAPVAQDLPLQLEQHEPDMNLEKCTSTLEEAHRASATGTGQEVLEELVDEWEPAAHPYAIATQLDELEIKRREREWSQGQQFEEVKFSSDVVARSGNFYEPSMFLGSRGAIEAIVHSNQLLEYRLTIGTCGQIAPSWVAEPNLNHPMWILHCPDLPPSHIEGCCFFDGLANSSINSLKYTKEDGTIGISYLAWNLGKFDKVFAEIDSEILRSLEQADRISGEIVIAIVGEQSCTVVAQHIPAGLVDYIKNSKGIFDITRNPINEIDRQLLDNTEALIYEEIVKSMNPPKILHVHRLPPFASTTDT